MKKILAIFAVILALVLFAFPILAEEGAETVDAETEETVGEVNIEFAEAPTNETLAGRVWEYVRVRKTALLTAVGDIALFAVAMFIKTIQDKRTKRMEKDLQIVRGDASVASQSGSAVVKVANGLIDGYNEMRLSYDAYKIADGQRDELVRSLMRQNASILVQNATVLEILKTVYINSRNLPQGVKDQINLEIANCRKLTDDDKALAVVAEAIVKNTEVVGGSAEANDEE